MEKERPNFYAIIPANVRYDRDLKANSKLMYGEITALCNKQGYCWASNNYFSELYGVTPQAISNWIKTLEKKGYISIKYIREGKQIKQRNIYIEVSINIDRVSTKDDRGINKCLEGYQQNFKENTTYINNTINNTKTIYSDVFSHYLSKDNLIKHKELTIPMKKAIGTAIKNYKLDIDYLKRIIDRHSEKIELNKEKTEFKLKARSLSELFGQKKYQSQDLICADYLDEAYETVEIKPKEIKEVKETKVIETNWRDKFEWN